MHNKALKLLGFKKCESDLYVYIVMTPGFTWLD